MAVSANIFEKCAPAIGTNIATCGTLTACDIVTATADTLDDIFMSGGDYRNMQSLLVTQFEIKACGTKANGLFDFLMANKKDFSKRLIKVPLDDYQTPHRVEPFVMAARQSVINQEYWEFDNGLDPGGTPDWQIDVFSNYGLPLDVRFFNTRARVYANNVTGGGSISRTAYRVISAALVLGNTRIRLTLAAENASYLAAVKVTDPVTGFLVRGTPNVDDHEEWCEQGPGLNPNQNVPFWVETNRWSLCRDQLYDAAFKELVSTNPYFARFGDIPIAKLNAQLAEQFQRQWLNAFFWNKRISTNQTLNNYLSLDNITTFSPGDFYLPNEGRCVGKRANAVGVYEQMGECGRIFDLQGQVLNLVEFFELIWAISRARGDQGGNGTEIDVIMNRTMRAKFQLGMIRYYNDQSDGLLRLNMTVGQSGPFGFTYDSYRLINPAGVTIRVMSNAFFDDFATEATNAGAANAGNMIWILDWATIYPGIIDSNRVVHRTGDIKDLARLSTGAACVMKNPTQEMTLTSLMWTAVVECPLNSAILEGIADLVPEEEGVSGSATDYAGAYAGG